MIIIQVQDKSGEQGVSQCVCRYYAHPTGLVCSALHKVCAHRTISLGKKKKGWFHLIGIMIGKYALKLDLTQHFLVCTIYGRDSVVGIATGYWLDDRGVGVRAPVMSQFSLLDVVQTSSGAHPASYLMDIGGSFPGG
jgi:hypothetical protein